jgi:hypothetical protein
MKFLLILISLLLATSAQASTLLWDRNTETDLKDYQVYGCFAKGCTVTKTSTFLGTVLQPAVGVIPSLTVNLNGQEGALAVSARDISGNESLLSVPLPFDVNPPTAPANLHFQ